MERMCPHGVGHPDPDDPKLMNLNSTEHNSSYFEYIHGCDGCCAGAYSQLNTSDN
jgi:hypothetical protein